MASKAKMQSRWNNDSYPIRISKRHFAIIARLAKESRKTQRVVIEESLELAWKIRRIPDADPQAGEQAA